MNSLMLLLEMHKLSNIFTNALFDGTLNIRKYVPPPPSNSRRMKSWITGST